MGHLLPRPGLPVPQAGWEPEVSGQVGTALVVAKLQCTCPKYMARNFMDYRVSCHFRSGSAISPEVRSIPCPARCFPSDRAGFRIFTKFMRSASACPRATSQRLSSASRLLPNGMPFPQQEIAQHGGLVRPRVHQSPSWEHRPTGTPGFSGYRRLQIIHRMTTKA